jgi:hypothetical protein
MKPISAARDAISAAVMGDGAAAKSAVLAKEVVRNGLVTRE